VARFFLALILCLSPQSAGGPYDLDFVEVRDGIWMGHRPDPYRSPVLGNVTIIVTDEDVVVVDSGSSPRAARRVIAKIRELTELPVSTLINTHGHEDHILGNQVFADVYPEVQIIARAGTRDYLESGRVQGRVRGLTGAMADTQSAGEDEIARVSRRGLNGDAQVAEHLRRYYEQDIYAVRNEYRDVRVTLPQRVFEGRMVLERPGRTIELLDLGFGKAGADVVVLIPEEHLVIAGDIVTHPVPYGFSRLQTEWLKSLRRLAALGFDDLVPGHGEVPVNRDYVDKIIRLVEFEIDAVRETIRSGRDADAAAWDITFAGWAERFVGEDPIGLYYFNEWFVKPAVTRAHTELSGR
jgi:glyoxylase-like metal-dependent hydrolase (beta-lactamase superfamily II)